LGKLINLLHTHHFALVTHSQIQYAGADRDENVKEVIIGIVTQIDLLHYIASVEEGARPR